MPKTIKLQAILAQNAKIMLIIIKIIANFRACQHFSNQYPCRAGGKADGSKHRDSVGTSGYAARWRCLPRTDKGTRAPCLRVIYKKSRQ